jgi:hypothetical protein
MKIALRFFFIENSEIDWANVASMIQTSLNNASNIATRLFSNELMYDFKLRNTLFALTNKLTSKQFTTSSFKILHMLNDMRIRNRQKTTNAVFFANVKVKIIHDKRHKFLFLNSEEKMFLRLHKKYNLFEIINRKLSQQKCDSFVIKRRVRRLTYELELFKRWKIHSSVSITQLKSTSNDSYKRSRSNHFDFVFVENDTKTLTFYEIKRILTKRTRQYEKIKMNQYLIKWKEYASEFDEWKNIFDVKICIALIKNFERRESHRETRSRKKCVNDSRH